MIYVGLTGGIGSGKSTVASYFKELDVPVYSSDERAKSLMNSSPVLKEGVIALLGPRAYTNGVLNRPYVADKIFGNKSHLQKINALVHPVVRKDFLEWAARQESPYVVQEAAVLFENGSYSFFDKLILVKAPKEERIKRVVARDNTSKSQVLERMAVQWDDQKTSTLSDYVIENISLKETKDAVHNIHQDLLKSLN